MKKNIKIFILALGFITVSQGAHADRGGKKPASKVMLNIGKKSTFGGTIFSNYSNGLKYTGSAVLKTSLNTGNGFEKTTITTFQKGNTIYIQPYRQVVVVPEIKQGYTGMKLIIKPY